MLEHLFQNGIPLPPSPLSVWPDSQRAVILLVIFSAGNSLIIARLLDSIKSVTFPISFIVLFLSGAYALHAQAALQWNLEGMNDLQRIAAMTSLGQIIGGVVLLLCFRSPSRRGP